MKNPFQYHKKSFGYAFTGLKTLFRSEHNISVHLIATILVIALAWWRHFDALRWCIIVVVVAMVWLAEAFNTAIERLCDVVSKDYHPIIKQVKDISAAAVLISAIAAIMIALLLFAFPLSI